MLIRKRESLRSPHQLILQFGDGRQGRRARTSRLELLAVSVQVGERGLGLNSAENGGDGHIGLLDDCSRPRLRLHRRHRLRVAVRDHLRRMRGARFYLGVHDHLQIGLGELLLGASEGLPNDSFDLAHLQ